MDRGYVDIAQFQRLTEEGVCYVTKMKKTLMQELESLLMSTRRTGDAHRQESAYKGTHQGT